MATGDLDELAARYEAEMPQVQALVDLVVRNLKEEAIAHGLSRVDVVGRVKDPVSFVRKAVAKGYDNPLDQITDKAGVRAVGTYLDDCQRMGERIEARFTLAAPVEDKRQALGEDKLGYGGIHYLVEGDTGDGVANLLCEIQVRTRAEDVWARVSHEVLYKSHAELPTEVRRRVYRLVALVELFDRDAEEARRAMTDGQFAEGVMIDVAERELFALTGKVGTDELSALVAAGLRAVYSADEIDNFAGYLHEFVGEHRTKLQDIFANFADDAEHPMLFRPESLLIFDRLEHDPFRVQDAWEVLLPSELLDRMAAIWGVALTERR